MKANSEYGLINHFNPNTFRFNNNKTGAIVMISTSADGGWSTDMCSFELRVIWTKGQLDYIEGLG